MNVFDRTLHVNFSEKERKFRKKMEDPNFRKKYAQRTMIGKANYETSKKPVSLARVSIQQTEDEKKS